MTNNTYSGNDAEHEIEAEKREQKKDDLKTTVEKQKEKTEKAEEIIEKVENALDEAKEAHQTEVESLEKLRETTIEDFEEIEDIETDRDREETVTVDDLEFVQGSGGKSFLRDSGSIQIKVEHRKE